MIENISNLIVAAAAVIGAITVAILAGLAIWTFRDIRSRSRDVLVQVLATVLVAVIPIGGILVYFMLRPRETLAEGYVRALEEEALLASIEHQEFCPSCGRRVDGDMQYCPACHTKLRNACHGCGRAVHLSWDLCPYCGSTLTPEMPMIKKPASRRIAGPAAAAAIATTAPKAIGAPVAAVNDGDGSGSAERSNLLERLGGVIEGAFDRLSSGKPQTPPETPEAGSRAGTAKTAQPDDALE